MPRIIAAILLVCLLGAINAQAADHPKNIAGYGKTTWGMTPDEVLNSEAPRAERIEKPDKSDAGLGIVKIEEIEVGDIKFSAKFIFDETGQKLQQVNLKSDENDRDSNATAFTSIERLLIEKYGIPTYQEETRAVSSWKLPKTFIELRRFTFGESGFVAVIYKPTIMVENAARDL